MTTKLIDTKDLTGAALSWAVAQAAGVDVFTCPPGTQPQVLHRKDNGRCFDAADWATAGPLLDGPLGTISVYEDPHWNGGCVGTEQYLACQEIAIEDKEMGCGSSQTGAWTISAASFKGKNTCHGSTYLEAAMRCLVTAAIGPWVPVPAELIDDSVN